MRATIYLQKRFAWDYADAELGALQQFNPTKMFIDLMAMVLWPSCRRLTVELRYLRRVLDRSPCMR